MSLVFAFVVLGVSDTFGSGAGLASGLSADSGANSGSSYGVVITPRFFVW